jgi:hypothetical protein
MPWQGVKIMTKENLLDRHIHLHTHELMPGRWLRPRSRIHARFFSRFLCGVLLVIGINGAFLFH